MARMIQIRNVDEALHRELKARAARAGMTLSDYLKAKLAEIASRPTVEEIRRRLAELTPVELDVDPATAIREQRGPL